MQPTNYVYSPAQRLAAILSKCFSTRTGKTRQSLRYAVYSKRVGREIASSQDLTEAEIKSMLEIWESHESPFLPSARALKECNELALDYQREHGQAELFAAEAA